jgi:hypothetical protein
VPITLNDLTVNFAHLDRAKILEDWIWLIGDRRLPILLSALEDAFVQDLDEGSVHLLSAGEGAIRHVADSGGTFEALLSDRDFVMENFAPKIIVELRARGCVLLPGQLYGYKTPPHLGGEYSINNLEPTDISVHFTILGQIHRQTQSLPPGTPIAGIEAK